MPRTIDLDGKIWPLLTGIRDVLRNSTKTKLNALHDEKIRVSYYGDMDGEYIKIMLIRNSSPDMPESQVMVRITRSGLTNDEVAVQEMIETGEEVLSELLSGNRRIGDWNIVRKIDTVLLPDRKEPTIAHWEMTFDYQYLGAPTIT